MVNVTHLVIMQILSRLHRHVRRETKLNNAFNVMDSKMLSSLHHLLDALLREIHREAVGASKKPTACSYRL